MAIENVLTRGQKVGLTLLTIGVVVNGVLLVFTKRQWQTVNQKTMEVKQGTNRLTVMKRLDEERVTLQDRFKKLTAFFPTKEEEIAKVAQKLEAIAKNSEVELKLTFENFPEDVDIGGRYQRALGVNAEIRGSYQGMVSWTRGVQQLAYFIRFSEVKIGTLEETLGVRAEFKGTVFLQKY